MRPVKYDLQTTSDKKRAEFFCNDVTATERVWGLYAEGMWALATVTDGILAVPFWSFKHFASQCAVGGWKKFAPTALSLADFIFGMLPGLEAQGWQVYLNPNQRKSTSYLALGVQDALAIYLAGKRVPLIHKLGGWTDFENDRLTSVTFNKKLGEPAARLLDGLVHVTHLSIDDSKWTNRCMPVIERLPSLRTLSLTAPRVTDRGLASLAHLTALEELELPGRRLTSASLEPLTRLPALRKLGLTQGRFAKDCFSVLTKMGQLVDLQLNGCRGLAGLLSALKKLPILQELNLAVSDIGDQDLKHVRNLAGLTTLDLSYAEGVTERGLARLAGSRGLRRLDLVGLPVSEGSIRRLVESMPDCTIDPLPDGLIAERVEAARNAFWKLPPADLPELPAWLQRAGTFIKQLRKLGGALESASFRARPPASAATIRRVNAQLHNPLPASLRTFFERGTSELQVHYSWHPPPERLVGQERLLGSRDYVYGETCLGPLTELPALQNDCRDYAQNGWMSEPEFNETQAEWLRAVPFLRLDSGDMLALDPARVADDPPVIYLDHENASKLIARNFGVFLHDWERLCYVDLEGSVLFDYCDPVTGALDPEIPRAQKLRELFSQPFSPIALDPGWQLWRDGTIVRIARRIDDRRKFEDLPVLADALEEAGCTNEDVLTHLRGAGPHVRGCWVVDLLLHLK